METSGSAFPGTVNRASSRVRLVSLDANDVRRWSTHVRPGPVAWKIRQLEPEGFKLDATITVVDCVNFRGYADTSYTAKLQAKYSDVILLTKHELVRGSRIRT